MAYYVRVLGKSDINIHVNELINDLKNKGLEAKFEIDPSENLDNWTQLNVSNLDDDYLIQIERNPIIDGELGAEELIEFKENIKDYKPVSAVKWLESYFNKIKVIYAFQLLNSSMEDDNFEIVDSIRDTIWKKVGGIMQADDEGFSNEDGYHILWQFLDNASGEFDMAVKNLFGKWINFRMNLGDKNQVNEFLSGKVPRKALKL